MRGRPAGFTLIEVVGAFFMMTVILIFVTGIFVENGRQRGAATELMRVHSTSAAVLDLIAQDLEGALFVSRPEGRDPRDHPWVFLADRVGQSGSTFLRFQTQNVARGQLAQHSSTWVEVVYFLTEEEEADRYTLWRWRSTRPPSDPARVAPDEDAPGSARVAEGLSDFGLVFVDANGSVLDEWDSTFGPPETPLPIAAEIRLALYRDARVGEAEGDEQQVPAQTQTRHVSIPMHQPIDVDALIEIASAADDGPQCSTVDDCLAVGDDAWYIEEIEGGCGNDDELCAALQASGTTCWDDIAQNWPAVAAEASPECETLP